MAGISRKDAKTVNLGIMYGMGVNKMAGVLDTSVDEAKDLLKEYHDKVPFVKGLATMVSNHAGENGQIRNDSRKEVPFPIMGAKDIWYPQGIAVRGSSPGTWQKLNQTSVYIQSIEQIDPGFECRPNKESYA